MKWPRVVAAAVSALALALVPVLPAEAARAGVDDFTFESFSADYTVDLDSSGRAEMRVVETIVALFPQDQNRGIIRAIPLTDGEVPLQIDMTSITDENGTPWYYERDDYDGFAEFSLGTDEFLNGRTTFILAYTVHDPVRHYADADVDEFYWDVNGNGWAQPFGTVSAHVEVGPALAAALTGFADCYVGYYGDEGGCELSRSGGGFDATVTDVPPYSTLTVDIAFAGGTVTQPALPRDSWIVQIAPKVLLALMAALLVASFVVRTVVLRDARGSTVIAQYTPPDDSDLLLDANVVDRPAAGLPALFVDLAVRGNLKVVDNRPGDPTVSSRRRFSLELVTMDGTTSREAAVLTLLFDDLEPGARVRPGTLDADRGASLYAQTASAAASAVSKGFRVKRTSRWTKAITRASGAGILAFIAVGAWAVWNDVLDGNVVWPGVGAVILAIAIPTALSAPARLTRKGAALKDHLLGMRLYLTVAEEDRLRMLQSPDGALRVASSDKHSTDTDAVVKLYERLLPYAVLWGVEDEWVEVLQARYPQAATPDWLDGDTFDSSVFRSFTSSSTSSVRPIVSSSSGGGGSSWSSSGGSSFSSGSSGGGFSGGGGGGGGGGGR